MTTAVTMRQMLEAGVHFWPPNLFLEPEDESIHLRCSRNKIHIINLEKTLLVPGSPDLHPSSGGPTRAPCCCRHQASGRKSCAKKLSRAGVPFVDHRWLGGMLTNFIRRSQSIKRLEDKMALLASGEESGYPRKNCWTCNAKWKSSERSLGGIKDMKGLPDAIFVIDTGYQRAPWWKPRSWASRSSAWWIPTTRRKASTT